eukprot:TRINITY_DN12140_c0_g1_i1.p1 TRINITY_DN12140_c0_g1~~TRINITY_DN12140_c0_g1_i1.p1  ORF type:complete len:313 (+),score=62.12 TRINITY_DN12140_c0_g1_i1:34-972(+)
MTTTNNEDDLSDIEVGSPEGEEEVTTITGANDITKSTLEKRRMLLVQKDDPDKYPSELETFSIPGRDGKPSLFAVDAKKQVMYEVRRHKRAIGSWLIADHIVKDGTLWLFTFIDPVIPLLWILNDMNQTGYKTANDILHQHPNMNAMSSRLSLVCDMESFGDDNMFKHNINKSVAWARLKYKELLGNDVLVSWYERDIQRDGQPKKQITEDERQVHVLQLLQEYLPGTVFDGLCKSFDISSETFLKQKQQIETAHRNQIMERDVDLKRKHEEDLETRKKANLATASMAVKRLAKTGAPKGTKSITSFFKKKA